MLQRSKWFQRPARRRPASQTDGCFPVSQETAPGDRVPEYGSGRECRERFAFSTPYTWPQNCNVLGMADKTPAYRRWLLSALLAIAFFAMYWPLRGRLTTPSTSKGEGRK